MYTRRPGLILGFHGCDQAVADAVIATGDSLRASANLYDWLGHGIYFWEYSPLRALEYAHGLQKQPARATAPIKQPAVIGAVIDLGLCLDLSERESLRSLKETYGFVAQFFDTAGLVMPQNKPGQEGRDLLRRELDCLVIETLHDINRTKDQPSFDSVRGVFWEGDELYPNAGFREKNHVQLCVRNPNCIKGYFRPRVTEAAYAAV